MTLLLETFDREVRRAFRGDASVRVEAEPHIVRTIGIGDQGWFGVDWSDLDESTADAAIAHEVDLFGALGSSFEWKYYDYDRPGDLEARLRAAGFRAGEDESVMIGEVASIPRSDPPEGIRIVASTDQAAIDRLIGVHEAVFGNDQPRYRAWLTFRSETEPESFLIVAALAGDTPVSAARAEFPAACSFAGLWGGGTLPEWRGKGIYRALVSCRADRAAERGYRYLHVDASEDSRPILERLGFVRIARTTPYVRDPDPAFATD